MTYTAHESSGYIYAWRWTRKMTSDNQEKREEKKKKFTIKFSIEYGK